MSAELFSRLNNFKQYISDLSDHIAANDNPNAVNIISKFKKKIMKQDPHQHANQFLLDCLRARNEKLLLELQQLQDDIKKKQTKISSKPTNNKNMKEVQVEICITRLNISLNEVKKMQYDEVAINSDYRSLKVNSVVGTKYKDYFLSVDCITNVEEKGNHIHLQYQDNNKLNILVRFAQERQLKRWVTGLKFAVLIQQSRKKTKLFEAKPEPVQSVQPAPMPMLSPKPSTIMSHIPLLSFNHNKPSQAMSIIEQKRQKSTRSNNDKMQKNTQRSLVNALNNQRMKKYSGDKDDRSVREESFGGKSSHVKENSVLGGGTSTGYRYQQNRPPGLKRIRGLSQNNHDVGFDLNKVYKNSGGRKNSQDMWKPSINQTYHTKMLEIKRLQEVSDDDKSDSTLGKKSVIQPQNDKKIQSKEAARNNRIKTLEERKQELLKKDSPINTEKSTETPGWTIETHKISWGNIAEEKQESNKSRSSRGLTRRDSVIAQSIRTSQGGYKEREKRDSKGSEHITEKSQQESPKFPKNPIHTLDLPKEISYSNGPMLRLHAVEKNSQGLSNPKVIQEDERVERMSEDDKSQSSSQSQSHDHSDPSSHQNHTESEDNAARAQQLKKGITLTKCSQNGFWSHQKIVYLSETENDICCRDISDKKIKKIKISTIKQVNYKVFDKGIIKHISRIEEEKCLVIRATTEDNNKLKNYEFYGNNAEALERFANSLNQFLQYNRQE